jgi:hypothetical protein
VGLNRDPQYRRNDDWSSMTLEEHRALTATAQRPVTDAPVGGMTSMKRHRSELQSSAVTEVYHSPVPDTPGHRPRCACARCEDDKRKLHDRTRPRWHPTPTPKDAA